MSKVFARRLTILNACGLYASVACLFIKTVRRFEAEITVANVGPESSAYRIADGKSILQLLCLNANQGTPLEVRATGPQAQEMIEALTVLINDGFGRNERCLPPPAEHSEWLDVRAKEECDASKV